MMLLNAKFFSFCHKSAILAQRRQAKHVLQREPRAFDQPRRHTFECGWHARHAIQNKQRTFWQKTSLMTQLTMFNNTSSKKT